MDANCWREKVSVVEAESEYEKLKKVYQLTKKLIEQNDIKIDLVKLKFPNRID